MYKARYRRILFFFARLIFHFIFFDLFLARIGFRRQVESSRPRRLSKIAENFKHLATDMGGVMIKVGQFLSTRFDILPIEITTQLAGLQDEVKPVPFPDIQSMIEAEFKRPIPDIFTSFDEQPLAAASLGQVHVATIRAEAAGSQEQSVVVKVQRPDIERIIQTDLAALKRVGGWVNRYKPIRKRANIPALFDEFARITLQEVDYLAEGRNAEVFARNFSAEKRICVPEIFWEFTTRRVITLENVLAIKITDYEQIEAAGIKRSEVANLLLDTYLKQIFEDGFFHADPHPGNLFVSPHPLHGNDQEDRWQLTFVDFGMVGQVSDALRENLRELLIAVAIQDSTRLISIYKNMGLLLPNADETQIENASQRVFERFWGKSMDELRNIQTEEILDFMNEFRDLLYDLPFQIPSNLIFLGRTVAILSGMCTGLDPDFNVWQHIEPYARKIVAAEAVKSPQFWLKEIGGIFQLLLALPRKLETTLEKANRGEISVRTPEVRELDKRLGRLTRALALAILFASLFSGAIQLYLHQAYAFSYGLFAGCGVLLIALIIQLWNNR